MKDYFIVMRSNLGNVFKLALLVVTCFCHHGYGLIPESEAFDVSCTSDADCDGVMTSCQDVLVTSEGVENVTSEGAVTSEGVENVTSEGMVTSQGVLNVTSQGVENVTSQGVVTSQGMMTSPRPVVRRCACDQSQRYFRHPNKETCQLHVRLGETCTFDDTTVCVDKGAICGHSGDLHHTLRCQCSLDDLLVDHEGTKVCARPLTRRQDPLCETCEQNTGRCYDVTGDGRRDGCQCPVSLSGDDCEIVHVFVNCTVADFTMTVCYDPHDGVNLTAGARMYAEDHGTDPACRGVPDVEGLCHQGAWRLELPLADGQRERCGTLKNTQPSSIKYENRIFVDQGTGRPQDYVLFTTFCLFQTHATASFGGLGVFALADGWAGQESKPYIELTLEDALGDPLAPETPIRLGDSIRFKIKLDPEGDYAAVRVEACLFSSSYRSNDPRAQTLRVLADGCPTTGTFFTAANPWSSPTGRPYEVTTGPVSPPQMRTGGATYLHCTVKLCLRGEIDQCAPKTCNPGKVTQHQSSGRRRRLALSRAQRDLALSRAPRDVAGPTDGSSYLELSKGIYFDDDVTSGGRQAQYQARGSQDDVIILSKMQFASGTAILILLLVVFITSTLVLCVVRRDWGSKVGGPTSGARRPPLFHLPRNT